MAFSGPVHRTDASRPSTLKTIDWIATALMMVGGINWGLVGLFGVDAVAVLFGSMTVMSRTVYILVGVAAVYGICTLMRLRPVT